MKTNFEKRRTKLKRKIKSLGVSALLITNIKNVGYLTGFTGSAGYLFVTPKSEILLSDSRYTSQLKSQCPDLEVDIRDSTSTMLDSVSRVAKAAKYSSVGYESNSITKSLFDQIETKLENVDLLATTGVVEDLRAIKDKSEIAAIRNSIHVNQRSFEAIRAQLTPD